MCHETVVKAKVRKKGFTLVELLVVVAIIALLVSILLPALGKARESAKKVVCVSNTKQIALGCMVYLEDNELRYPDKKVKNDEGNLINASYTWLGKRVKDSTPGSGTHLGAHLRPLNPYVGGPYGPDDEVLIAACPSDKFFYDGNGASYTASNDVSSTEAVNGTTKDLLSLVDHRTSERKGVKADQIRSPDRMVTFSPFVTRTHAYYGSTWWVSGRKISYPDSKEKDFLFHTKDEEYKWNMCFADGHASFTEIHAGKLWDLDYTFLIDK